jgi:preprotein translocase subunit SecF
MSYTYRIWDKISPINNCPVDKALQSLGVGDNQLAILSQDGHDCITQIFPQSATDADVKAWCDKVNANAETQAQNVQQSAQQSQTLQQQVTTLGQQVATLTTQNAVLGKQVAALTAAGKAGD